MPHFGGARVCFTRQDQFSDKAGVAPAAPRLLLLSNLMRGWSWSGGVFASGYLAIAATVPLVVGDAGRGREVLRAQGCLACHSAGGVGGKTAPDLGFRGGRGFSPSEMAALLWNHAPRMWAAMTRQGIATPVLSEQQAADLFAYFYAARYFDRPGDAQRGREVFAAQRCADCHRTTAPGLDGAPPLQSWRSSRDPVALALQLWNHSAVIRAAMARRSIPYPRLSSRDLSDILAYADKAAPSRQPLAEQAGAAPGGEKLFVEKGCAGCHTGEMNLRNQHTRFHASDFAAALWNHAPQMPARLARLSYPEMRAMVDYLGALQFFEERGSPERGKQVFVRKGCASCHSGPATGAPSLASQAGRASAHGLVEALWKHGPAVLAEMRRRKVAWPQFTAPEMADLAAYLHGPALKRRAPDPTFSAPPGVTSPP